MQSKRAFSHVNTDYTYADIDIVLEDLKDDEFILYDYSQYQLPIGFSNNGINQTILESYVNFIRPRLRYTVEHVLDVLQERHQPLYPFVRNAKAVRTIRRYIAAKMFN